MSLAYPYFGFPSMRRRRYYSYKEKQHQNSKYKNQESKDSPKEETKKEDDDDIEIFEIFGIKLRTDDILIIGLLFLLYTEGVKDQGLFVSLIMLLLDR